MKDTWGLIKKQREYLIFSKINYSSHPLSCYTPRSMQWQTLVARLYRYGLELGLQVHLYQRGIHKCVVEESMSVIFWMNRRFFGKKWFIFQHSLFWNPSNSTKFSTLFLSHSKKLNSSKTTKWAFDRWFHCWSPISFRRTISFEKRK